MQIGEFTIDTSELVSVTTLTDGGQYFLYGSGDAITEYPDGSMVVDQGGQRHYFNADGDPVSTAAEMTVPVNVTRPKKTGAWFWLIAALVAVNLE